MANSFGSQANLVVDDQVHRSAGVVAPCLRQLQGLHHHALSGERSIAMHQQRQHAVAALVAATPAPKIAVLDLESTGVPDTLVKTLSLVVPNAVRDANPHAEILSSGEIRSLIGFERQKQLLGCTEGSSCMAEIGDALGAQELISGSLGKVGSTYVLQLRRVDVARAKALASSVETIEPCGSLRVRWPRRSKSQSTS